jgi:hypothetical protein
VGPAPMTDEQVQDLKYFMTRLADAINERNMNDFQWWTAALIYTCGLRLADERKPNG